MAEGRSRSLWGPFSAILAGLANIERVIGITLGGRDPKTKAFTPADFDPYSRGKKTQEIPIKKVNMRELAGILGGMGVDTTIRPRRMKIDGRPEPAETETGSTSEPTMETDDVPGKSFLGRTVRARVRRP